MDEDLLGSPVIPLFRPGPCYVLVPMSIPTLGVVHE